LTLPPEIAHSQQAQIEGLATLLVLDDEVRKLTSVREFGFFCTNETHRLIPYHTAFFWQYKELIGTHLVAQSGTPELDVHAPPNQWLKQKIQQISAGVHAKAIHLFSAEDEEIQSNSGVLWHEALPGYLLWCPLLSKNNTLLGGMVFFRETPFSEVEIKMLRWLIATYQFTWRILAKSVRIPFKQAFKKKRYVVIAALILLAILLFPVRLSVLGSGTVVPKNPVLVNSPIEGIIKSFAVNPGQHVVPNQLLLTIDKTDLQSAVEVNQMDYKLTQAKLRTAVNKGFNEKADRTEIPILQAQLAIDSAHLNYSTELLAKTEVRSSIAGIVIFDGKEDWLGQPVRTGERILIVANPTRVKLKITIPVAEIIELKTDSLGNFFIYGQLSSLPIKITSLGYNAKLLPNKVLSYQLEAEFVDAKDMPQIGSQGNARLYGRRAPFIYYLLRRPIQAIRQTVGI
jgi:hypothetical protein